MKSLWAPWRMTYLNKDKDVTSGCLFCNKLDNDPSEDNLVIYQGKHVGIMLNKYPYNNGHLLLVPNKHVSSLEDLSDQVVSELAVLNKVAIRSLRSIYNPDGFNVGINIGEAAGAGIPDHIHMHILPRWSGDTNFITTIAEARVIPEEMRTTYYKLRQAVEQQLS